MYRDWVLKTTGKAVKDRGVQTLNGKQVRVLEAKGALTTKTVYVDPQTGLPVQIVQAWPGGQIDTFDSIQVEVDLDDRLFSLDVPPGYKLIDEGKGQPANYNHKILAKLMRLALACNEYSVTHGDRFTADFPAKLT